MSERIRIASLEVDSGLAEFINGEVLPLSTLAESDFWSGFASLIHSFTDRNSSLLRRRDELQKQIDGWHLQHREEVFDSLAYTQFLRNIDYLLPSGGEFSIETENVDPEIASIAGPQLVVPVKNARFALNAANARWGSLYDALYGTDAIAEENGAERAGAYNPIRGERVIAYAKAFLDQACPLKNATHSEVTHYSIVEGHLHIETARGAASLSESRQLIAYRGDAENPAAILLQNHGLHIELQIDRKAQIGSTDLAGIQDIVLEAAITTIQDCEDSVAAVDASDKIEVYRNWLGLMRGDLSESFTKNGAPVTRTLSPDREYVNLQGESICLPGRSLLFVRNVGHLMRNSAVLDEHGEEIYEGILDAVITGAIGAIDIRRQGSLQNSRSGSIYIVKPKMHGPEEVEFTCALFAEVETLLNLKANTLKIGIMDEERRTTLNLKECIRAAKDRVAFINTGFLDRTGDEIHTSMQAGVMVSKADMKASTWIAAYENNNVDVGLACGLQGRAQIGKGMWAMPDLMAKMIEEKIAHPLAGASTAWVPSPTAAVLHAMHYHKVDVVSQQREIAERKPASLHDLLSLPLQENIEALDAAKVQQELENNCQSILGYVVRWIDQGVGCSKVLDIHNIGLMEDRATLRISSQHIANWLHHKVCSEDQVRATLERMAAVVDQQNSHDPLYRPMSKNFAESVAFQAACDLVFDGLAQPNGYTEPRLHARRLEAKLENENY